MSHHNVAYVMLLTFAVGCKDENTPAQSATQVEPLPVMFTLPEFSLTERSEKPVTLDSLAGKVWVANFIFTNCGGPCPIMSAKMEKLQEQFAGEDDLRCVTITVDPYRDTPKQLRQYADARNAHPERWLFLTGERDALFELSIEGFKLAASDDPDVNMEDA